MQSTATISTATICYMERADYVWGLPPNLVALIERLDRLEIAAFVTKYDDSSGSSPGRVVAVNPKFLTDCGDRKSVDYLGNTYQEIHGPDIGQTYANGEIAVLNSPSTLIEIDEGPKVEVVKVAIPSSSLSEQPQNSAVIYVIGFFKVFNDREEKPTQLDCTTQAAKKLIQDSLNLGGAN